MAGEGNKFYEPFNGTSNIRKTKNALLQGSVLILSYSEDFQILTEVNASDLTTYNGLI